MGLPLVGADEGTRTRLNAARKSAAGKGSTEPLSSVIEACHLFQEL